MNIPKKRRKEGGLRTRGIVKNSSSNQSLISIITPSYNSEKFIEETINSVLNQDYNNIEYIIIDGGSTDGTLDIIKKYEDRIDYWISEPDKGIYDAMHKGILQSNGSIIGNINSDDYYAENVVTRIVEQFTRNQHISVVHGSVNVIAEDGTFLSLSKGDHNKLHKGMSIKHPTVFLTRKAYLECGGYDLSYRIGADRELMLRLQKNNHNFLNVEFVVASFRKGGISDGIGKIRRSEARRIYKKYKLSIFRYIMVYYIKPTIATIIFRGDTNHNKLRFK